MKKLFISIIAISALVVSCKKENIDPDKKISVGDNFEIELPSPSYDGGYSWNLVKINNPIIDSVNYEFIPDNPDRQDMVGRPGIEKWKFKAIKSGTQKIRFEYNRWWEKNSTINVKEIILEIE